MNAEIHNAGPHYRLGPYAWLLILVPLAALLLLGRSSLALMADAWLTREEYSYGMLIPVLALFLAWQRRDALERIEFHGSWWGVAIVALGTALFLLGTLAALAVVEQYALLVVLYGAVLALIGFAGLRVLWMPLLILLFMIPLPEFVLQNLSGHLQLVSTQIGVWFVRLFDIAVFVEGNVIDLGTYRLQVAEACDGLRYLFPLMTLGFIMAYFFRVATWKRVALFLTTIPLTVLMNSFRIGAIGVMVEHWGIGMAEGFLHDFQGWVVFMVCGALLLAEMALLARLGPNPQRWRDTFSIDFPAPSARRSQNVRPVPKPFVTAIGVFAVCAVAIAALPERTEIVPSRDRLASFPTNVNDWNGRRGTLDRVYLDKLELDDYLIADYARADARVNMYVAWYDSQRAGRSAHSPRSCLPGGGWRIAQLDQVNIPVGGVAAGSLRVNRVLIELGNEKQLVYYWFQQRGRSITNEYLVKWYLFVDSLTKSRTDGALVRLVTPLRPGESAVQGEERLAAFLSDAAPRLDRYIPR
jgi:exosortase D (VPLPA-CTERM-specific)